MLDLTVLPSRAIRGEMREQLLSLCSRAYGEDFSAYLEMLYPAQHILARWNGELVSHAAWVERTLRIDGLGALRTAYVEAVATLPERQGQGFGSALLAEVPPLLGDFALAALSPTHPDFYRRLGWELWQGPLGYTSLTGCEVPSPEEQVMIYRLPLTPVALDVHARLSTDWRPLEVW